MCEKAFFFFYTQPIMIIIMNHRLFYFYFLFAMIKYTLIHSLLYGIGTFIIELYKLTINSFINSHCCFEDVVIYIQSFYFEPGHE